MITDLGKTQIFANNALENRSKYRYELFIHKAGIDITRSDLLTDIADILLEYEILIDSNDSTFCNTTLAGIDIIYLYFNTKDKATLAKMVLSSYNPIFNEYSTSKTTQD